MALRVVVQCAGLVREATWQALEQERIHHRTNDPPHRPAPIPLDITLTTLRRDHQHDYGDTLAELWELGAGFINLEHDVAPWPGALTQMWQCPEPWCALPLVVHGCVNEKNLGCVKFSAAFIFQTKDLWKRYPRNVVFDWRSLDAWLYGQLEPRVPHRHEPPALHCNWAHVHTPDMEELQCHQRSLIPA